MKRFLAVVLIMAVIMPSAVKARDNTGQTVQNVLTGLAILSAMKDAKRPDTKPASGSLFGTTQSPTGPVIVVTRFEGDYGELAQEEVTRVLAALGYQARAAVGTKELNDVMDELQLENSEWGKCGEGRNPIGELAGAQFLIVGRSQVIGYGSNEAETSFLNGRLEELTMELTIKAFDVRTGKMAGQVMKASGTARKLSEVEIRLLRQRDRWWGSFVEAELSRRLYVDLTRRALAKAADNALSKEMPVASLDKPVSLPVAVSPQKKEVRSVAGEISLAFPSGRAFMAELNPGKKIHQDDRILFSRDGASLAEYAVVGISGQTVLLELVKGRQPETKDDFKIVCSH